MGKKSIPLQKYSTERWYKVHVDLDYTANTGTVYIDDVLKADDVPIFPRVFNEPTYGYITVDKFTLSNAGLLGATDESELVPGPFYFDDILLS